MSFLRCAVVALVCFAGVLAGVNASGFSAQLTQPLGALSLGNGANSVINNGGTWITTGPSGFQDGQFQADGAYIVPVQGAYHFDATLTVAVNSNSAPFDPVDIRIVKCANGCNQLCGNANVNPNVASTLIQSGTQFLSSGFQNAFPPTYSLSASFTGYFNTGDLVALCVDSSATSGAVRLVCAPNANTCAFSGFSV